MEKYSLIFGVRSDRPNKNGEVAIFLRYTFKRKWVNLSLGETIPLESWNKEFAFPVKSYSRFNELKNILQKFEERYSLFVEDYFSKYRTYPTVDVIKNIEISKFSGVDVIANKELRVDFLFEKYIQNARRNDLKKATLDIYGFTLDKWNEFSNEKYPLVTDMNLNTLKDFRIFLNEKGLRENTVGKYIKTIKSFLNYCYFQLEITSIPISFKKIEVDKEVGSEVVHLSMDELEIVKREAFYSGWYNTSTVELNERERLIGQIFIFLCSTGCSYTDFHNLRLHHIHIEKDNLTKKRYITIEISRQKIKSIHKSIIPIVDVTIDLLIEWIATDRSLYSFEAMSFEEKKVLLERLLKGIELGKITKPYHPRLIQSIPVQVFNREIKSVFKKIGLNRKVNLLWRQSNQKKEETKELWEIVSTHTGRRTYVTLSLEQGISMHHLMQSTGHTKTSTLLRYNKTSRESVSREFEEKIANRGSIPE